MMEVNKIILCGNRNMLDAYSEIMRRPAIVNRREAEAMFALKSSSISNGMPEAGGGGSVDLEGDCDAGCAAPEVAASDDDDGGDSDGEPARSRPHSKPSNSPAPSSASKKHSGSNRSRTRHQAEKITGIQTIAVGEIELAESIGMSVEFLRKDRSGKRLIPFYRIGTAIRYNPTRVGEALSALEQGGYAPKPKASKARQFNQNAG